MAIEIERKFLVDAAALEAAIDNDVDCSYYRIDNIRQGYLVEDEATKTVLRVRIVDDLADAVTTSFITVKRAIDNVSRFEFEYDIPNEDAEQMMGMCPSVIEKTRRYFAFEDEDNVWEIDTFDMPDGSELIIAETELDDADQQFTRPDWLRDEVTDDPAYYNSEIAKMISQM